MAWQVAITTMAIVIGLPVGSVLAGIFSWRWMFGFLACIFIIVFTLVFIILPRDQRGKQIKSTGLAHYKTIFNLILRNRSTVSALLASIAWGIFWQGWGTYNGAFFIQTYNMTTESLAPIFTVHGLATVFTSTISGRIADRFSKKTLAAFALIGCAIVIGLMTNITIALWLSITLFTILAIPAGLRLIATNSLLTELIPQARGTIMSINASFIQIGTMIGVAIGGFVIESTGGYALIGTIYGITLFLAALILLFFVVETGEPDPIRPIQDEHQSSQ
jgi:predicted MFS family arabinose efflux permease